MNTRQALLRSVETTPDALSKAIETQRVQLSDQLVIAQKAFDQDDLEGWAVAARFAANVKKALEENLEMQNSMTRLADLVQFTAKARVESVEREALAGDKDAIKAITDAHKRITAKKAGGARGSR